MNNVIHRSLFLLFLLIINGVLGCDFYKNNHLKLECNEEPFRSLKLPLKHVNGMLPLNYSNYQGDYVLLVRMVDYDDKECYLALIWRADEKKFKKIITKLPLSWDDDRGNFRGMKIPDHIKINDLISGKYNYEKIDMIDEAIFDLINIYDEYGNLDPYDTYSSIAFKKLNEDHNSIIFFLRRHITKYMRRGTVPL